MVATIVRMEGYNTDGHDHREDGVSIPDGCDHREDLGLQFLVVVTIMRMEGYNSWWL